MNNTKNPTAIQSQKWILQALLDLMKNNNYDKITVSEICRKADLDRRTFYRNFDSKLDVLRHYLDQLGIGYMTEFSSLADPDRYTATLLFLSFWERHLLFIKNMQHCGLSDFVFTQFEGFIQSHRELMTDPGNVSPRLDYIFAYRLGGYWNVMLKWASRNADLPAAELAAILSREE